MQNPSEKQLAIAAEIMAYARKCYEHGWDFIVECKTEEEIAAYLAEQGVASKSRALALYRVIVATHKQVRADIQAEVF